MESKRITGTEMEWAPMISCDKTSLRQLTHEEVNPHIEHEIKKLQMGRHGIPQSYFLANGARLYGDINNYREYATPEDDSFTGTCANEFASETIIASSMKHYEAKYRKRVSVVKRVIDDEANSSGYHISYSANAERMSISENDLALFGVFAATRNVLFGSGALLTNGNYILGQKAHTLDSSFNGSTTAHKPVVNLRHEPHADRSRFLRIHDTSSDPNMSPWSTRVKLAAGSLTLKLIEQGMRIDSLRFEHSIVGVARGVSQDIGLQRRYKLADGSSLTALETQARIVKEARKLEGCSDEELWALDEWEKAINALQKDPRLAIKQAEWFLKLKMLERAREKEGVSWDSQLLRYKDRQFSEIMDVGKKSIAQTYRESIWSDYMPPQQMIENRVINPPETTRASLRGRFIDYALMSGTPAQVVNWNLLRYQDHTYVLDDPFNTAHQDLEELINKDLTEAIPA